MCLQMKSVNSQLRVVFQPSPSARPDIIAGGSDPPQRRLDGARQCENCWEEVGGGGFNPPLNVFNPLVALVYLYLGSDVTPQIAKRSKMLNFLVNTWVFKAQNAPKPVFGRGSAPDPAGGAYDVSQTP